MAFRSICRPELIRPTSPVPGTITAARLATFVLKALVLMGLATTRCMVGLGSDRLPAPDCHWQSWTSHPDTSKERSLRSRALEGELSALRLRKVSRLWQPRTERLRDGLVGYPPCCRHRAALAHQRRDALRPYEDASVSTIKCTSIEGRHDQFAALRFCRHSGFEQHACGFFD